MPVFNFLMEIEKEVESLLGFSKKLSSISEGYIDLINFVKFLNDKLRENSIDYQYTFKQNPEKFVEEFKSHLPLRSQMIVLFSSLDVLFNLHMSYEYLTSDEDRLRELTMNQDNTKKFLNRFILNDDNSYYKDNKERLSKIDSSKLRGLRNSLTHFFSIGHGGLSLAPDILDDRARKLESIFKQNKNGNVVFVSPKDLYGLIKEANLLRMKKWDEDFNKDRDNFKKKISFVIDLVKREGAVLVFNKDLNKI